MEDQAKDLENKEHEKKSGSWIWDKSMVLGKRILVTGFVISTAPVVFPPLMVISAIGLAASVPYGVFLAGYVCTEKLMSKLLPLATVPEEKYDFDEENEEEKLKRRIEIRLDSDEMGNEEEKSLKQEEVRSEEIGEQEEEEEPLMEKSDDKEADICGIMIEIEETDGISGSVEDEEPVQLEVTSVAIELAPGDNDEDNEELVKETTGLIENLRDEGMVDDREGKEKQSEEHVHGRADEELEKDNRLAGETLGQSADKNADPTVGINTLKIDNTGEQNDNRTDGAAGQKEDDSDRRADEEDKSVTREEATVMGGRAHNDNGAHVKQDLHMDEKAAADSSVGGREVADKNRIDDKNEAGMQSTDAVAPKGSTYNPPKDADTSEVPVVSSRNDSRNEVLYSEEKIWKEMDAVRKIVGYTARRKATCMEELKALYIFTGVEPPASVKDPWDLVEVNNKLKFLMSVIGVK